MENNKYLSVSALNKYIQYKITTDINLKQIYLKAEISNFRISKGHMYFVLKDDSSEISAIMFSFNTDKLKFLPKDGMTVLVKGSINLYEKKGTYNILVNEMEEVGLGVLYQKFLRLKEKLSEEGLFSEEHKKPIPEFANNIGVITSDTGDALHDILSTINNRYPLAKVFLYPALVQGNDAPKSLIKALRRVNDENLVELIIIGRGGGSFEDLSCFNDEDLAREIYNSNIPIISGVGHESDFTICDFVSDFRAPTPTGAAVKATKDKNILFQEINLLNNRLVISFKKCLEDKYYQYRSIIDNFYFKNFLDTIIQKEKDLQNIISKLNYNSPISMINRYIEYITNIENRFSALNFEKHLKINLDNIGFLSERLNSAMINQLDKKNVFLDTIIDKMITINPLNLMRKGYTLTYQNEKLITSIDEIDYNKGIKVKFNDGELQAKIIDLLKEKKDGKI